MVLANVYVVAIDIARLVQR